MKAAPCQTACGWVGTECKGCIALAEPGSPGRAGSAGAYDSFFGPAEQRGMRESLLTWLRGDRIPIAVVGAWRLRAAGRVLGTKRSACCGVALPRFAANDRVEALFPRAE